ncbi:MAG: phosphoribosylamine--glycine ligase [Cryobacterium sp.]|nr:phosphoribosylamine--glycine ligase [Cryobacterium sp.]MBX3089747.1 phosphoribosylamine--glycine ligase [Cryobacterium sp.]MCO5295022.1 phosphoribosylamine--glycine ligase [Homoserinimonas sp.]MCW5944940.1 phosphoribosylamine--glycine ligase [Cryobacterium sp.]
MRILILGSGAREHALLDRLLFEQPSLEVFVGPGNAGMADHSVELDPLDAAAVCEFASARGIDLVVVGPEAPLAAGVTDALRAQGTPVFGPSRAAARLESSKNFAKEVMIAAGVPTGASVETSTIEEVEAALNAIGSPFVVKADGLAAGKGVIVTEDRQAALDHAREYLGSGSVLVEEFLAGPEVSLFVVTDGTEAYPLVPAQDFKRVGDGDTGPNTGGMGSYSPLNWLPAGFEDEVMDRIALPVIRELAARGTPFCGLLYCGLVLTSGGTKVIEFNVRFGDPETQVILPRLTSPLSELLFASATGTLASIAAPEFSPEAAVCVVLASEGYPASPKTGRPIRGLDAAAAAGAKVLHAATRLSGGEILATGGRVLSVVGTGPTIEDARGRAYDAIGKIELEGSHYRTDIARGRS